MSAWWMLLIVPLFMVVGFRFGYIQGMTKEADRHAEELAKAGQLKPAAAVTLKARRDIPLDVWMDRIEKTDAKAAAAWLQLSMAQQLASEAAQYVQVTYCYDPVKKVYEISARLRAVPWRSWE